MRETRGRKKSFCEEGDERMQRERRETKGCKESEGTNVFGFLNLKFQIAMG